MWMEPTSSLSLSIGTASAKLSSACCTDDNVRARAIEHTRSARDRFRGLVEGMDHLPCLRHAMERRPGSRQKRSALANVVDTL
jgi:hypothetical protein